MSILKLKARRQAMTDRIEGMRERMAGLRDWRNEMIARRDAMRSGREGLAVDIGAEEDDPVAIGDLVRVYGELLEQFEVLEQLFSQQTSGEGPSDQAERLREIQAAVDAAKRTTSPWHIRTSPGDN